MRIVISFNLNKHICTDHVLWRANLSSEILKEVKTNLVGCSKGQYLHCAAGIVFDQMLNEFLMNAFDAKASNLTVTIEEDVENNTLSIAMIDDGNIVIPESKLGQYCWYSAIQKDSEKKDEKQQLGGKHLALAICAHFLEMMGEGKVVLEQKYDEKKVSNGAIVRLFSSTTLLDDMDVSPENLNYARMMINDARRLGHITQEQFEALKNKYSLKPGEREARDLFSPSLSVSSPHGLSSSPSQNNTSFSLTSPMLQQNASFALPPAIEEPSSIVDLNKKAKKKKPPSLFASIGQSTVIDPGAIAQFPSSSSS
ncbi:MAG: hypothetical protein COY58_05100 [Gammaproteobacteria bacterium CG_4_10_14_0_8_um_filter_38_16]|nr:MAG: hypothetical protein COY58_05100 [Gammaproteobacteria bacterium CG_4_10_14_0_8_um_filter_38_16]PJA02815.1 MAG: hypothetical protein COX72_08485 [Gammaproteobacteria bacterium CG_4_10_14_0_2_um_filter_38_22]PJB09661.1 MAG: hypothetical protein CO120_08885 [Gammaproteobacteria bacterium CG_4_9_14_3_um_filter_38_9]